MILRNLLIASIILFLYGCGYQSIYSNKDGSSFSINEIFLTGEASINRKILNLTRIKEAKKDGPYSYDIRINSEKLTEVIAKDNLGNASIFKMTININVTLMDENQKNKEKLFSSSFLYNNSSNKFDLTKYKNNAKDDLIERLAEKILIFLNTQ